MEKKNLVTFLQIKGKLDSEEICLDGNHFDAEFIEDKFDIRAFQPLKIIHNYQEGGNLIIDIQDREGNINKGLSINFFRPYKSLLNKEFQDYLKQKN